MQNGGRELVLLSAASVLTVALVFLKIYQPQLLAMTTGGADSAGLTIVLLQVLLVVFFILFLGRPKMRTFD